MLLASHMLWSGTHGIGQRTKRSDTAKPPRRQFGHLRLGVLHLAGLVGICEEGYRFAGLYRNDLAIICQHIQCCIDIIRNSQRGDAPRPTLGPYAKELRRKRRPGTARDLTGKLQRFTADRLAAYQQHGFLSRQQRARRRLDRVEIDGVLLRGGTQAGHDAAFVPSRITWQDKRSYTRASRHLYCFGRICTNGIRPTRRMNPIRQRPCQSFNIRGQWCVEFQMPGRMFTDHVDHA